MIFTNYAAQKNKAREPGCSILRLMPVGCYSGRMCLEGQPNVALSIIWKPDNILLGMLASTKRRLFAFLYSSSKTFRTLIPPNGDLLARDIRSKKVAAWHRGGDNESHMCVSFFIRICQIYQCLWRYGLQDPVY